ncbi:hypothetical protein BC835DRAFT_92339 [Cytidiella melzeri]|nr:hypothetical protein BC835DRAFT_92339 [Cytidiella melzeri]
MPSATFQFNPGKMADAFEYVRDCFEWLAAGGGDLESIAHELKLEKFARGAEHLLSDIRSTQNRLAPVNQLPPELLGAIFAYLKTPHIPAKSSIEFIKCKWPVAQSICRHWRFAAVHTPVLWSFIQVDSYFISFQNRLDFVSAIFARSGALPLDLRLRGDGAAFSNNKSLLSSNSWRIQELHARGPSSFFLESCLQEANQLETLVIVNGPQHVSLWRIPRLRTLVASNFTGWHGGVFRTLRHLILEDQPFNAQLLRGLHSLLTLNPLLEDLVIKDVWGSLELETTLDALPSVNMPGLRRISIQCPGGFSAVEGLVSKKLVLQEGHARFYGFPVPAHHLFPLRKLFITAERRTGCVVGTDGRTYPSIGRAGSRR